MLSQTPIALIERGDSELVLSAALEFAQASADERMIARLFGGDVHAVRRLTRADPDRAHVIAGIAADLLKRLGDPERVCYAGQTRLPGHGDRRIVDRLLAGAGGRGRRRARRRHDRRARARAQRRARLHRLVGAEQVRAHRHDVVAGGEACARRSASTSAKRAARVGSAASTRSRSASNVATGQRDLVLDRLDAVEAVPARRSRAGRRRAPRSRRRRAAAARRSRPPGAARRSTRTRARRARAPGTRCCGSGTWCRLRISVATSTDWSSSGSRSAPPSS